MEKLILPLVEEWILKYKHKYFSGKKKKVYDNFDTIWVATSFRIKNVIMSLLTVIS